MSVISDTSSLGSIGEKSFRGKEGYKKTQLGWIPEEWEIVRFQKIANFNPKSKELPDRFVYIDLESVKDGVLQKKNIIEKSNAPSRAQRLLKKNDVLFQTVRPYQKNNLFFEEEGNDFVASSGYAQIRSKHSSRFIFHLIQTTYFNNQVLARCTGTSFPAISSTDLSKVLIKLPTLPERQKIATILSTWDRAIAKQQQLIAAKQEFKKGLMQLLLTGKKRFEGFEREWESKKLKSLGKVFTGGTPSSVVEEYWNGDITWYTPSEIREAGKYIQKSRRKITSKGLKNSSATIFPKNTIVVCTRATIGELAISLVEACTNQGFKNLNVNENNDVEFIYYKLRQSKTIFMKKACGSTFLELSTTDFRNLILKVPPLPEQQKIASVLSAADKEIGILQSELATLRGQKRGLMQRLLTGEVRVKIN